MGIARNHGKIRRVTVHPARPLGEALPLGGRRRSRDSVTKRPQYPLASLAAHP